MNRQPEDGSKYAIVKLMADVVSAYVSNNPVPASELPPLVDQIYRSLDLLLSEASTHAAAEPLKPAVPIKKSVTPDFIILLESDKTPGTNVGCAQAGEILTNRRQSFWSSKTTWTLDQPWSTADIFAEPLLRSRPASLA